MMEMFLLNCYENWAEFNKSQSLKKKLKIKYKFQEKSLEKKLKLKYNFK